ncbi:hypothetical protein APE01nite_05500 [Acetobacter peroxydans]|uniref:Uncharacterized protein n=1 Tax=Acetobacter peroxydans TaxID=104098 RepID=A0A4Y3TSQ0_9PROT|nr:hypothetical protein AA0475_2107 [Acetobacter peroxydans]GEB84753.1 hypothetical protein APE01nite_05500 [Acetobacter peroxydans]
MLPRKQGKLPPHPNRQSKKAANAQLLAGFRNHCLRNYAMKIDIKARAVLLHVKRRQDSRGVKERISLRHQRVKPIGAYTA